MSIIYILTIQLFHRYVLLTQKDKPNDYCKDIMRILVEDEEDEDECLPVFFWFW